MNKTKRIIYVAANGKRDYGYANWLEPDDFTDNIEEATIVLGLGGADVSPRYYNQPNSGLLYCSPETDAMEFLDFKTAIKLGKKIIGTCKSAQWAAAMAGGSIFQDIRHPGHHTLTTFDGLKIECNSGHHNMQNVLDLQENIDYKLLAWTENLSPYHINGYGEDIKCEKEPEVVYYPKINWLAFQNHNESLYRNNRFKKMIEWSQDKVDRFLNNKL